MFCCLQPIDVRLGLVRANVLFPAQSVPQWHNCGHTSRSRLQTWCFPDRIPSHRTCSFPGTSLGGSCAVLNTWGDFYYLVLHVSLTAGGMNGAEFDVFAINRNIERRCMVRLENFTKSSGYDSIERPCGLYCLPYSQNKILLVLRCVSLRNVLF